MGWGGVLVRRRGRMGTKEEEGGGGEKTPFFPIKSMEKTFSS